MNFFSARTFFLRLVDLLLRRRRDARLSLEIEEHLEALADQYRARGMSDGDARLAARRAFGGVDQTKMLYREQRGLPSLDSLLIDLRYTLRVLAKDRLFTAAAVVVLALGLAVNTTVFTIINGMTWRGLPVDRGEQIVHVSSRQLRGNRGGLYTSHADFRDWQAATTTLSALALYGTTTANVGDDQHPADRLGGVFVSANAFATLRMPPRLGRDFTAEDDRPGAPPVVLLGHHVWVSRYAADPAIVGRIIRINGTPTVVAGVMPEGFRFPLLADLWLPAGQMPGLDLHNRAQRRFDMVGRLRDGSTVDEAQAEFATFAAALAAEHPDSNTDIDAAVRPFTEAYVGPATEGPPLIMLIAAVIVLLIACSNAANLLLARAVQRGREIALRAALGASRARILRQLLVEALALSSAGAAVGLLVSIVVVRFFAGEAADARLPYWIVFEFDARVFAYLALVSVATAFAFGTVPAWRLSKAEAHSVMKEGGRGSLAARGTRTWTAALVVGQLAMTVTLLAATGVIVRSGFALYRADAILDLEHLVVAQVGLPAARYASADQRRVLHARIQERLDSTPGVASAALASARPFVDSGALELRLEGESAGSDRPRIVQTVAVGDRYFETLGLNLRLGRALGADDRHPGTAGVVINERFAAVHFNGVNPIGRRIHLGEPRSKEPGQLFTIVGVSASVRQRPMGGLAPLAYVPIDLLPEHILSVILRGVGTLDQAVATIREELRAVDPDLAAYNIMPLQRLSELSRWTPRLVATFLTVFAVIATLLCAAGLYAVTAFGVAQGTSEIGIRMALGARRSQVAWMFLRRTLIHVTIGLALGIAGALAVGQLIRGVLVNTSPADPLILGGMVVLVIVVAGAATFLPARRAMRLDPGAALRHE